jgi:hypothetical protein
MAIYVLPDLPYDYSALEPYISGELMELHHDKRHHTYVNGVNSAVDQLAEARGAASFGGLSALETESWPRSSTRTSGPSLPSRRPSRRTLWLSRDRAGRCWHGTWLRDGPT